MADKDIILEVRDLKKYFKSPTGTLHAVDGVNFSIRRESFHHSHEDGFHDL